MKQILVGIGFFVFAAIMKLGSGSIDNAGVSSVPPIAISKTAGETFRAFKNGADAGSPIGPLADYNDIAVSSTPSESVTYKIKSNHDSDGSTITIKIVPGQNGGSEISADIDIANVRYGDKYLAEDKVMSSFKTHLNNAAASIDQGNDASGAMREINQLMITLAMLTNSKSEAEALEKLTQHVADKTFDTSSRMTSGPPKAIDGKPQGYGSSDSKSYDSHSSSLAITGAPSAPLPGNGAGYGSVSE